MHAGRHGQPIHESRGAADEIRGDRLDRMAPLLSGRASLKTLRPDRDLDALLERDAARILDLATAAITRARLRHYADLDEEHLRELVASHIDVVIRACATLRVEPILEYVERLAANRFASRFDLRELQTAFNVIAEALWGTILSGTEPESRSRALAIISTVAGIAKDALACRYLALASERRPCTRDSRRLFQGTQESLADVWAEPDASGEARGKEM